MHCTKAAAAPQQISLSAVLTKACHATPGRVTNKEVTLPYIQLVHVQYQEAMREKCQCTGDKEHLMRKSGHTCLNL